MGLQTWQVKCLDRTFQIKGKKDDVQHFQSRTFWMLAHIQQYQRERTGRIEADGTTTDDRMRASMLVFGAAFSLTEEGIKARLDFINSLPEHFTVPSPEADAIKMRCQSFYETWVPITDKRRTVEAVNESIQKAEAFRVEREAKEAAAREKFLAAWGGAEIEVPEGVAYFEIEAHYDDSDAMTDYFHTASYGVPLLLQFTSDGARREENYRAAISHSPLLTALEWKWKRHEYSMGRGTYLASGGVAETEDVETYGGHKNPVFHWEVRRHTRTKPGRMFTFKGYGQGAVLDPTPSEDEKTSGAVTVRRNHAHEGIEITFENKPAREVLDDLKAHGWRWSFKNRVWYKKYSESAMQFAEDFAKAQQQTVDLQSKAFDIVEDGLTPEAQAPGVVLASVEVLR